MDRTLQKMDPVFPGAQLCGESTQRDPIIFEEFGEKTRKPNVSSIDFIYLYCSDQKEIMFRKSVNEERLELRGEFYC